MGTCQSGAYRKSEVDILKISIRHNNTGQACYGCEQYRIKVLWGVGVRPTLTRFCLPCGGWPHRASWSTGFDLIWGGRALMGYPATIYYGG